LLAFLSILLAALAAGEYYYFTGILYTQKSRLMTISRQYEALRLSVHKETQRRQRLRIAYEKPPFTAAVLNKQCELFLGPWDSAPIVEVLRKGDRLIIIDMASINEDSWLEVGKFQGNTVTTKGWIKNVDGIEPECTNLSQYKKQ